MIKKKSIKIVGCGLSGLSLAYYLNKRGAHVEIYDARESPGGMLQSIALPLGLVERAANAFIASKNLEDMATDIHEELLLPQKGARKRYIYLNSRAQRWPLSFFESVGFFIRLLFIKWKAPHKRESLEQWGLRALGKAATFKILGPALQGIYAGDIAQMSAQLVVGKFFGKSKSPVQKAKMRGSVAPKNGMGAFCVSLKKYLESHGVAFHLSQKVTSQMITQLSSQSPLVIATSLSEASLLLEDVASECSQKLKKVEMIPLTSATLFYPQNDKALKGFGVLFHPKEGFHSLGVLFNHCIFPGRTALRSETWIIKTSSKDPELVNEWIAQDHQKLHQIKEAPMNSAFHHWPQALPHYTLYLEEILESEEFRILQAKGIYLTGNYLGQLGLSKIIDYNEQFAEKILANEK